MGKRGPKPQLSTELGKQLADDGWDIDWLQWAKKQNRNTKLKDDGKAQMLNMSAAEAMREVQRIRKREDLGEATPEDRRAMAGLLNYALKAIQAQGIEFIDDEDDGL